MKIIFSGKIVAWGGCVTRKYVHAHDMIYLGAAARNADKLPTRKKNLGCVLT